MKKGEFVRNLTLETTRSICNLSFFVSKSNSYLLFSNSLRRFPTESKHSRESPTPVPSSFTLFTRLTRAPIPRFRLSTTLPQFRNFCVMWYW